jgi:hypothetical protein
MQVVDVYRLAKFFSWQENPSWNFFLNSGNSALTQSLKIRILRRRQRNTNLQGSRTAFPSRAKKLSAWMGLHGEWRLDDIPADREA